MPTATATNPVEELVQTTYAMYGVELTPAALKHPLMPEFQRLLYLAAHERAQINTAAANLAYRLTATFDVVAACNLTDREAYRIAEANRTLLFHVSQTRHVLAQIIDSAVTLQDA